MFSSPTKTHHDLVNPFTSERQISYITAKKQNKKRRCFTCNVSVRSLRSKLCCLLFNVILTNREHLHLKLLKMRRSTHCPQRCQLQPPQGRTIQSTTNRIKCGQTLLPTLTDPKRMEGQDLLKCEKEDIEQMGQRPKRYVELCEWCALFEQRKKCIRYHPTGL